MGIVALAFAVVAGSAAGVVGLSRVFGEGPRRPSAASTEEPEGSTPTSINGDIVFIPTGLQGGPLSRVSPDGTGLRQLTPEGEATYRSPDVSPDGRTVVVVHSIPSFEPGLAVLATVPIDGGSPTWLSEETWVVGDPAWSPDGGRIAFAGSPGGPFGIYILELSTGATRLVPGTDEISGADPTWSPDGSRIAFQGSTESGQDPLDQSSDIYSVRLDGSDMTNVTRTPDESESGPAWSWTQDRIAFIQSGPAEGAMYTMAADGSDVTTAYSGELVPGNPAWSPDGTEIAFEGGSEGLKTIRADGTELADVPGVRGWEPAWQRIAEETDQGSPAPSPEETPIDGRSAEPIPVLRLGFPTCDVTSVSGVFASGVTGTAWAATKTGDLGTCPDPGTADHVIAVDVDGDGQADGLYGPFRCDLGGPCEAYAAPDVNRDGVDELVVSVGMADGVGAVMFEVTTTPDGVTIEPVGIEPPGDPKHGFDPDAPILFQAGGGGGSPGGAYCVDPVEGSEPLLVIWRSVQRGGVAAWDVTAGTFRLSGNRLVLEDIETFRVPEEQPELPPSGQDELCGAPTP